MPKLVTPSEIGGSACPHTTHAPRIETRAYAPTSRNCEENRQETSAITKSTSVFAVISIARWCATWPDAADRAVSVHGPHARRHAAQFPDMRSRETDHGGAVASGAESSTPVVVGRRRRDARADGRRGRRRNRAGPLANDRGWRSMAPARIGRSRCAPRRPTPGGALVVRRRTGAACEHGSAGRGERRPASSVRPGWAAPAPGGGVPGLGGGGRDRAPGGVSVPARAFATDDRRER